MSKTETKFVPPANHANPIFYSEDWTQRKVFAIVAIPYFDIIVDQDNLYLIRLDKFYWSTIGTLGGLLVFTLIGAIIGYYLGSANDKKKRAFQRSAWINKNQQLISSAYNNRIFLKLPIQDAKRIIILEKCKIIIQHNGEKIFLAKNLEETTRLNQFLNDHVL